MIYYFMVFIKLKYQTKPAATQWTHILYIYKRLFHLSWARHVNIHVRKSKALDVTHVKVIETHRIT